MNALDYLLKPADPARLALTLARLVAPERRPPPTAPLGLDDRIFFTGRRGGSFVKVGAIAAIRGADDYSELWLVDGAEVLSPWPLKAWEARLPASQFARTHRTAIENLDHVVRVERESRETLRVLLRGREVPVPVSRRHAARLRERFG